MEKMVTNKKKLKKNSLSKNFLIGMLIFTLSATGGFAFVLPVYDVANQTTQVKIAVFAEQSRSTKFTISENSKYLQFVETMNRCAQQFRNWQEEFNYAQRVWTEVDRMRGNWRLVLSRLADQEFVRAVLGEDGRDLIRLGWELRRGRIGDNLPNRSLDALERIERILASRTPRRNFLNANDPTLREDLQEIFGQVPATRPDIENAHRTLARTTSSIADINRAIRERRANIEQWKQAIAGGGLVPGDLERLQIMINAEEQDISLLNARLSALNIEVNMALTGLLTAEESGREIARARADVMAASFIEGAGLLTPAAMPANNQNSE